MDPKERVYVLPLTNNGSPDVPGGYVSLPSPTSPPYILRFLIEGSSPICRQGSLWVNIPSNGEEFDRGNYKEYQ